MKIGQLNMTKTMGHGIVVPGTDCGVSKFRRIRKREQLLRALLSHAEVVFRGLALLARRGRVSFIRANFSGKEPTWTF